MNQITFPRISYDGSIYDQTDLEKWYLSKIQKNINTGLKKITGKNAKEKRLLSIIINHIDKLILYSPQKLDRFVNIMDTYYKDILLYQDSKGKYQKTDFNKEIFDAFHYDYYRKNILVELAQKLNVKSCPYCNMNYTLFAEKGIENVAKFQYDHFFDKKTYPFLSMCLYNLIPSCVSCNQGKSTNSLSLKFNPYASNINKLFHFTIKDPLPLFFGKRIKDIITLNLTPNAAIVTQDELNVFDNTFNIRAIYSRHKDIVQEVFDKAYLETYYGDSSFFNFLDDRFKKEYLYRLIYGVYMDENEIEKRPMSKFVQDIRKQAIAKIYYDYLNGWCF